MSRGLGDVYKRQVYLKASIGGATEEVFVLVPEDSSESVELVVKNKHWCFWYHKWEEGKLWLKLTNTVQGYEGAALRTESVAGAADEAGAEGSMESEPPSIADTPAFGGTGDAVSDAFAPPAPGVWNVSHDGQSDFVVTLRCAGGSVLVQDTTGPVAESVRIDFPEGPCRWEVEADGNWALAPQ